MTPTKIAVGVCLAAGLFGAGYLTNRQPNPAVSSPSVGQVRHYICPMHPQYKSDRPGDCPSCGMRLEPVRSDEAEGRSAPGIPNIPGTVQVSSANQQLIGVRTEEVQRAATSHLIRLAGRIAVDEARLYRIIAATDGWVRELGPNPVGTFVKKDQILASHYVRELVATQQNYLYAYLANAQQEQAQTNVVPQRNAAGLNIRLALDAVRSLGMTDLQIEELQRTREPKPELSVRSPVSGFVIARSISPGQRFDKGTEMYRIADISHVWVMADVFEKQREFLEPGAMATLRYRGREFRASMSDALPQFDPLSRTLKTRFELDNPGLIFRPDMFVDVEVHVNRPAAITVPADAVIETGRRKTVYVDRGSGTFEPRLVQTGWRLGDRVQVIGGLEPGERVVVSGNFLIDSESRMRLAPASAPLVSTETVSDKDPVCGMDVNPKATNAIQAQIQGRTYTFCSQRCKQDFDAAREKYVQHTPPAPANIGMRGAQ